MLDSFGYKVESDRQCDTNGNKKRTQKIAKESDKSARKHKEVEDKQNKLKMKRCCIAWQKENLY